MGKDPKPAREERLAAKLRENLRRRKAQARLLPSRLREGSGEGLSGECGTTDPPLSPPAGGRGTALPKEKPNG